MSSRWQDRVGYVVVLLGSAALVAAGMNGFLWFDVRSWWRLPARAGMAALGLALIVLHVLTWARRHRNTLVSEVPPKPFRWWLPFALPLRLLFWFARRMWRASVRALTGPDTATKKPRVKSARGREARLLLDRELVEFTPLSSDALFQLVQNLLAPFVFRRGINERQMLRGATMDFEVTLDLLPGATIHLAKEVAEPPATGWRSHLSRHELSPGEDGDPREGARIVVLARPYKDNHYGRFAAKDGQQRLHVLSRTKSLALLYAACRWQITGPLQALTPPRQEKFLNDLAELLLLEEKRRDRVPETGVPTTPPESRRMVKARKRLTRRLVRHTGLGAPEQAWLRSLFEYLLVIATRRRPYFAIVPGTEPLRAVTYTFTTRVGQAELPEAVDRWRRGKDGARGRLRLPSKFVGFDLGRSRATEAYVAEIELPAGMYVDEAYLVSERRRFEPLPRDVVREGYVGMPTPNGRPDMRVATWKLRSDSTIRAPLLLVRMLEIPPGSIFTSALVAAAVLLSVWLTGVVVGLNIATSTKFTGVPFALVTLATTLPGLLSTWWGIAFSRTVGVFRSLTGIISLTVSVLLSLTTLVIFVARQALGSEVKVLMPTFDGHVHTIYLLRDWVSFSLFFLALVNFGFVLGLFISRLWRYNSMKAAA